MPLGLGDANKGARVTVPRIKEVQSTVLVSLNGGFLFRELYSRAIELFLYFSDFLGFNIAWDAGIVSFEGRLPLRNSLLQFSLFEVDIAHVVMNGGVFFGA